MANEESLTTNNVDETSSDISNDDSLLDSNQPDEVADESTQDIEEVDSADSTTDSDSNEESEEPKQVDKKLAKFLQAQGIDPAEASDSEIRLAKIARDNQKAARTKSKEMTKEVNDLFKPEQGDSTSEIDSKRLARLETTAKIQDFWSENPEEDRKELEPIMARLIKDKREAAGDAAAWGLASDLNTLLILAKYEAGSFDTDTARESGRIEERKQLRKKQEGSLVGSQARNSAPSKSGVTKDWIENEYDPDNPEHRQKMDAAMSRGEIY